MSSAAFFILAVLTLSGALAAATLPRLIHSALCFVVSFIGLAAFYFLLGAEFVGLVQVFVYVGAVAVLIVFTILLTRRTDEEPPGVKWSGVLIALAIFGVLFWAISHTALSTGVVPPMEALTVKRIGEVLMADYVWPLQGIGVLLTAALLGALVLVMEEKR